MPRLGDIREASIEHLNLPSMPWLQEIAGIRKGGIYLLAGEPGIGKTTLAIQIFGDLALQGNKVLYLTNEQTQFDLLSVAKRVLSEEGELPNRVKENFLIEHLVRIEDLEFWHHHLFLPDQPYSDVSAIAIDSVQGGGTASTARASYRKLYSFTYAAKNHGITSILIGHVTKDGKIAGPKDLEHEVDAIIHLRRAFKLRPLFVPKNRYGPARLDPVTLTMDKKGRLVPSPYATPSNVIVHTVGYDYELRSPMITEVQANVLIPKYGERPKLRAPYLPSERLKQLLTVLSQLPEIDISNLTFEVNCYVRGSRGYHIGFDLPIALGIVTSYLRERIPASSIFTGEVDLTGRIRPPGRMIVEWLGHIFQDQEPSFLQNCSRIYISSEVSGELEDIFNQNNIDIQINAADDILSLFKDIWPHAF
ncbi:MAG: hypothetical protein EFT35_07040 [Methanophagales archaeon ANME-1-THS]|nr:MAG: hypothetical protein EFT35_07040 [Methanophagales archaeon ANME-1-THS]